MTKTSQLPQHADMVISLILAWRSYMAECLALRSMCTCPHHLPSSFAGSAQLVDVLILTSELWVVDQVPSSVTAVAAGKLKIQVGRVHLRANISCATRRLSHHSLSVKDTQADKVPHHSIAKIIPRETVERPLGVVLFLSGLYTS